MKYVSKRNPPSVTFLASTLLACLAVACTESNGSSDGATTQAEEAAAAGMSAPSSNSGGHASTQPSSTTAAPGTGNTSPAGTGNSTGNSTPSATTSQASSDSTPDELSGGAGGAGPAEATSDSTDSSDEPATDGVSSDPEDTEAGDTSTGNPGSDATGADDTGGIATDDTSGETSGSDTLEPNPTTNPPSVGECSSVIKGELTECADPSEADPNFSFFVASRLSMVALSGAPLGFGGNLGGLECADTICALIAECVAPGNAETWHAFLSTAEVDAKDRIGTGPWYDVIGTKIADDASGLIGVDRPTTADGVVNHNLPNEFGCESLTPACDDVKEDNHHVMTGSNEDGTYVEGRTCNDWTSADATPGTGPAVGLSFERSLLFSGGGGGGGGAVHWINFENESGCGPGGNLDNNPPQGTNDGTVGSGGGYGAIYCFAVTE